MEREPSSCRKPILIINVPSHDARRVNHQGAKWIIAVCRKRTIDNGQHNNMVNDGYGPRRQNTAVVIGFSIKIVTNVTRLCRRCRRRRQTKTAGVLAEHHRLRKQNGRQNNKTKTWRRTWATRTERKPRPLYVIGSCRWRLYWAKRVRARVKLSNPYTLLL